MRVLVTRPRHDAERTAEALRALGHEPLPSPVMEVVATGAPVARDGAQALIATSAQAFNCLGAGVASTLAGLPLFLVGARTARAAQAAGLGEPEACTPRAEDLVPAIASWRAPPARLLYLAGHTRKPDLEMHLLVQGYELAVPVVYEARPVHALAPRAASALRAGQIDAVLHFSRRSAALFMTLVTREGLAAQLMRVRHICISDDAAEPLEGRVVIAPTPDSEGLFAALEAV